MWWFFLGVILAEGTREIQSQPTEAHYSRDYSLCKKDPETGWQVCCLRDDPLFVSACENFDKIGTEKP